jgi:hypothetical protein
MTVDEARAWLSGLVAGARGDDQIAHAPYVDRYQSAAEPERARLREAMALLLEEGNDEDQLFAARFLDAIGAQPDVLRRLAQTYLTRGLDGRHPVAGALGRATYNLPADVVAELRRQFVADPIRHFGLAYAVLRTDARGQAWDSFVRALSAHDQVEDLISAFRAAFSAERENDFYSLMRDRPEPVLRAVAEQLSPSSRAALLGAAGLKV